MEAQFERAIARTLLVLPTGCHRRGQPVLMSDGTARVVEEVVVGDRLLGPDGKRRTVLELVRGRGEMFEVQPVKGASFVVDGDHVLTLVRTPSGTKYPSDRGGMLVDVTVREWLSWPRSRRHLHKLLRVGINFPPRPPPRVDPYVLGVLLGDGSLKRGITVTAADREIWRACRPEAARWGLQFVEQTPADRCHGFRFSGGSHGPGTNALLSELDWLGLRVNSGAKRIPDEYRLASRTHRLGVLAGLLDTDGHLLRDGGYELLTKSPQLGDDVAFVARSLGLAAYVSDKFVNYRGERRKYYRVSISGDVAAIPCRVRRKIARPRRQKKNVLRTGFRVVPTGTVEQYFGFRLDRDQRYLLDDFTVTHNCGKTVVFAELVRRQQRAGRRALVLAHREELLEQAQRKLADVGVWSAIEKAERRAGIAPVVVASVQTLQRKRLQQFGPDAFGLVVVDEAHHATAASYRAIVEYFTGARVLGVTATPDRADGKGLGEIFGSVAYRYELREAIRDRWLVPIVARRIFVESVDLSGIKSRAGDLAQDELAEVMAADGAIVGVVVPLLEQAGDRRTIVFGVSVAHAMALAQAICERRPGAARVAHGEMDSRARAELLADFRAGEFQFLVNCALFTEGFDEPSLACVACARPTKSRALYTQMVGRGTRLADGKRDLLVLDFVGNAGRHKLVGPLDALAAGEVSDDVRKEAERRLEDDVQDLDGLVDEVTADLERRREEARRGANTAYFTRDIDPFLGEQLEELGEPCVEPWALDLATADERTELTDLGLKKIPIGLTRGEAQRILAAARRRGKLGLATFKQCRTLKQFGFDPTMMTKAAASARIGVLALCDWDLARAGSRLRQIEAHELIAKGGRP